MSYKSPTFNATAFNCPHSNCNAFAHMHWSPLAYWINGNYIQTISHASLCSHCKQHAYWLADPAPAGTLASSGKMLYPSVKSAAQAHLDMPPEIKIDYDEARNICQESPRGSAALLRLCVQKLCKHLGESGKNINEDIGALVKKGLPIEIQQALDIVRVIGNNAVHPGELSSDDVQGVASTLFELVNYIVEDRIARPKKLSSLFSSLPAQALDGIANRDENNKP